MNIWGYKLKLIPIRNELKKGKKELGEKRYNQLFRRKASISEKINNLRLQKKK